MIATLSPAVTPKRADAAPPIDASPVRFRVVRPMYFRGEPTPVGATINAELDEAVELQGNHHLELVALSDAQRIHDANERAITVFARASGPRASWVTGRIR